MPAKSRRQWRLMKAIAEGTARETHGITKREAQEYIRSQPTPKGLPETTTAKKKKKK